LAALEKILDAEQDAKEEHVGDVGNNENGDNGGDGEYELHSGGVSSCAQSSCRTCQQTNFFANFGNDNHSDSSYEVDSNDGEEDDLDNVTCDELADDGNDEDAMDDDNDATDDDDDDGDRDGQLCALKAKIQKEKLRRHKECSPCVWWKKKCIHLCANILKKQAIEMKERAMVLMKEWRSMQPNPTLEWMILELERLGVRKLNGHSASLSDELKARKEVAEVSILDCFFF